MTRSRIAGSAAAVAGALTLLVGGGGLVAAQQNQSVAAIPEGFEQYLVYISEPSPGAFEPVTYGEFLERQADVWGRDAADVAALRAEAIAFFDERFGVDFSAAPVDPDTGVQEIDGATLAPDFVRDERHYRAYMIGGERVPASGWDVRDASFNVTFTEDVPLDGDYTGTAPAGSFVVFGDYNIEVDRPGNSESAPGRGGDEIHIRFRSGSPITMDSDGVMTFVCDLTHLDGVDGDVGEWGTGQARGIVTPDGGIRNVLTFPPSLN